MTKMNKIQSMSTHPTPYSDVNTVLHVLLKNVQTVLGNHFVGMYVYGSLSSGDFDPRRSDIDFLVVTADRLPDEMIAALKAMHARITARGLKWAKKLEGSYISQHILRRYEPPDAPRPYVNEGSFYLARYGNEWTLERHIIREQGIVVKGPAPQTLIDPTTPNDLRRAVVGILHEWWSPMLHDPARLHSSEYRAYAILTMCRMLHTLQYGTVVSKPVAARWAQKTLGKQWEALIKKALAWQHHAKFNNMNETLDFIRYTLERSRQIKTPNSDRGRLN